ncbi:hypothetical protein GQ53DRAFT_653782 [Thozetella sp. PMI_491]|nr:hypothetical protein GQ53DRAFT_653782 [Thozetella sp. PMI_491]
MASIRSRTDTTGRFGAPGPKRTGSHVESQGEGFTVELSQRPRNGSSLGPSRLPNHTVPQPKMSSRIPQTYPRRPSNEPMDRPPLTHQSQSWSLVNGANPPRSMTYPVVSAQSKTAASTNPRPQPRNVLRRKQSGFSQETSSMRNDSRNDSRNGSRVDSNRTSSSSSEPQSQRSLDVTSPDTSYDRSLTGSPMEIRFAHKVELPTGTAQTVMIYPELDRYRDLQPPASFDGPGIDVPYRIATHDLPPPTPLDTTPTSISSQSPGLIAPSRLPATRARQASGEMHTRPPVTRRRAGSTSNEGDSLGADPYGLAAVRESLTSSSSNSTVRDEGKKNREKRKKKRLSPLPPSPPPRKSSQKFQKSRDEEESPSPAPRVPAQPVMTSPSPEKATSSSHVRRPSQPSHPVQPSQATIPKATPPARPSRDGTPDLQSQFGLSVPVIHSNLSSSSLPGQQGNTAAPVLLGRSLTPSSLPDRQLAASRLPLGRDSTPALSSASLSDGQGPSKQDTGRYTRTPSPKVSTFKTRFPLFGRRTKPSAEGAHPDKQEKPTRKGPAAGTGHEGYGRLGAVRRRSSSAARDFSGTLSSQESLSSNQPQDPFLADRMAPVIIAGGEVIENRNASSELSRTNSELSVPFSRPAESRNGSQVSLSSRESTRQTLWPSAFPREASQAPSLRSRRPSDSSDSEALAMKSTLAYRRSMQRMKNADQQAPRLPKPINTRPEVVSPAVTSIDESIMSDDSPRLPRSIPFRGRRESDTSESAGPKKLTKRARSPRKWNLFGRSQTQSTPAPKKAAAKEDTAQTVAATVKIVPQKPVAFYTMMDSSEQEDAEPPKIEDVVREARESEPRAPYPKAVRRPSITQTTIAEKAPSIPSIKSHQSIQRRSVTSPIVMSPPLPHLASRSQATPTGGSLPARQGAGRPSRLPQVGRIPKVVSARPEQTSPKSFSRPFHRISVQLEPPKQQNEDMESLAKGPSPPKPSTPDLTNDESTVTGCTTSEPSLSQLREFAPEAGRVSKEFLSFSPRKNSLGTVATTCSSCSGTLTYADATAIIPAPNAPLAEDEIWDEYNDLLGEENLLKVPPSVGATVAKVFRRRNLSLKLADTTEPPMESPTINLIPPVRSLGEALLSERLEPTSSIYSADTTEKIKESLDAPPNPSSPFSVSKFVDGYGHRNNSIDFGKVAHKPDQTSDVSAVAIRRSDASSSSQGSDDNSPLSQVNLRVGSMTVSKWLTFGHVLFSPVREQLTEIVEGSLKRQSILVIDGLGNDDWSFYAAETYPAATFFNLSPRAPLPADHRSSSTFPLSPPNHHQVQFTSLAGKFPFGQESFSSVVFRFPGAAPEIHYRNVISEARRVLKPGGFIELSILDVDLNNMGNHGRRAVRRLKQRIQTKAPDTSLGSTSDLMLRLLGRNGFTDIKTCRVGVPVTSAISRSSGSERGSDKAASPEKSKVKPKKDDRSLAEMMSDESPVADENITKMVTKVGRWWYSRCYETAAVAAPSALPRASLWNDRALLAECQEWGTSLKLMVCHARAPDGRSRLASI